MRLGLTVPLGEAETPASFTSRVAAANGVKAAEFCLDWDLRFQAVVDGNKDAISAVAGLGGADAGALLRHAFVRRAPLMYECRGQKLIRAALRRARVFICPDCALDDIARLPKVKPHLAVYGRGAWLIDAVRTCPDHNISLVDVTFDEAPGKYHDFAYQVRPSIPRLADLLAGAVKRRPSGLERYVLARLEGTARSELLDRLDLFAAIKTCEVLGAVAEFGTRVNLRTLPDAKMAPALARGFEIADGGPAGIRKFLDGLVAAAGNRRRKDGPGATFGRIHQWLMAHQRDPAYAPVRDAVGRHVLESFPLVANTRLFGALIASQTRHSIRTLSLETGQHPKKLRKTLRASGIIGDAQMVLSDHNVIFDAVEGSRAAREAKASLYLPAARAYLNAPRVQADLLVQHGFIRPKASAGKLGVYAQYAVDDLDAFLAKLKLGAKPVGTPSAKTANIPGAARQACCSAADIVRMILEKKLAWTGVQRDVRGYLSVLVKVNEVKAAVRGPDHGGLTTVEVREALQAHHRVVLALVEHGHLATFRAPNPVNRCIQTLVATAELKRFRKTYVSLYMLAKERNRHHVVMKTELDAAGIRPALDHRKVFARFYRRSDCPTLASNLFS